MRHLAPYQSGVWLAEYLNSRCQLCRVTRSTSLLPRLANHQHSYGANSLLSALGRRFNSGLLCVHCHTHILWLPDPFYVDIAASTSLCIQSASYYEYPIRQAIHAFKHQEDMTKLPLLVYALRQLPRPKGCHLDNSVIVAMPTTNNRLMMRGFDPVTVLSAYLSKHWQIPLWQGVQRIDNTVSQRGLGRAERLTNLDDAFSLTEPLPVKRLLLFDDVATTGASLQALARTLYTQSVRSSATSSRSVTSMGTPIPTLSSNAYHISAYALAHGSHHYTSS